MRRLVIAIVFAAAGCATAPSAAYFTELEQRWLAALQAHDTTALNELLDDSFVDSTSRGGTRTKHDVFTGPPAGGAYRSVRLDELKVRAYGSRTVIVTGVNVLEGPSKDTVRVRFTDVFCKSGLRWRAVAAQETLEP
ncbi:MAG TPA: nuclear transport factor 2 family protein [Thermoanaerobaculia bacterium]|nr:nuclear transport factor 2 family protein [Thermoanaerobaculia bacterium]